MNTINPQQQPLLTTQVAPPPTDSSGIDTQTTQSQINETKEAVKRTKDEIAAYIRTLGNSPESFLDMDGDGRVTDYDANFIDAYIGSGNGEHGKRGADLKEFVSPNVIYSPEALASMENKAANLVNNKKFDFDGDGTVDSRDVQAAKKTISQFAKDDSTIKLQGLINNNTANINGGGIDSKDMDLIKAYFIYGKRGDSLKMYQGKDSKLTGAQLEAKLATLGANKSFDSDANGKIEINDISRLEERVNKLTKANGNPTAARRDVKIRTLIESNLLDVNGDGKTNSLDMNLVETYNKKGLTARKAKSMSGAHSSLSGEQVMGKLKTLFDSGKLDVNENLRNGGKLDLARIRKAVEEQRD